MTPDRVDHAVSFRDPFAWSEMPPPETLGILWDRLYFAQETYSEIDVLLYGYREDPNNPGKRSAIDLRRLRASSDEGINDRMNQLTNQLIIVSLSIEN